MADAQHALESRLGASTVDRIWVRGFDLCRDLLGTVNLGDMAFLELRGRLPTPGESRVTNAILVALVEHGITPSALATRLTYLGAPEAVQGAVAAGLLGLGTVFVGTIEGAARLLMEALAGAPPEADPRALAAATVEAYRARKAAIPGIGHPLHVQGDPRTARLFAVAEEAGLRGRHVALMEAVSAEASRAFGRPLPLNATGAIGALLCELGFDPRVARGFGVMSRAIGLVGHIFEEIQRPMAREVWRRVEAEANRPPEADPPRP
jgi:citrate synthase